MKNVLLSTLFFIGIIHFTTAQTDCLEKGITTNPAAPSNPEGSQNSFYFGKPWLNDGDFNWLNPSL